MNLRSRYWWRFNRCREDLKYREQSNRKGNCGNKFSLISILWSDVFYNWERLSNETDFKINQLTYKGRRRVIQNHHNKRVK